MTTIAYKDGVIAADTQATYEDGLSVFARKLHKTDHCIIGHLGDVQFSRKLHDWYILGEEEQPTEDGVDSGIVVMTRGGIYQYNINHEGMALDVDLKNYHAWGTGNAVALGALHHGATAQEAVRASIKHDSNTGGNVHYYSLDDLK